MAANLGIKLINRGDEGELLLIGRLDANTVEEAQEYFNVAADRFDHLILNLDQLQYISSAGLRVLKLIHIKMQKKGGQLSIRNANNYVMEVFEMTGFAGLLNFI